MASKYSVNRLWRPGYRKPIITKQRRPDVSVRDMEYWHPGSVWHSLLKHANWLDRCHISRRAKALTRIETPEKFAREVNRILGVTA